MVWRWLRQVGVGITKFLLPHTPPRLRIDQNATCPACGHRDGRIQFARDDKKVMVRHDCHVCRCAWLEAPISVPEFPAI